MELLFNNQEQYNISPPRYLFKYRPLGEFTNKILSNNELYYSCPERFNDPFDCHLSINDNISNDDLTNFLKNHQPEMQRHESVDKLKS